MMLRALLLIFALILSGCAPPRTPVPETVTVEGEVTARGHQPFSAYVLETDEQNLYVIEIPENVRDFSTPARIRATGRLIEKEWDGRPFAHIQVERWERIE